MGYSNNKWRKLLTILTIINLCFILFAKFSKVFGAYNDNKTTIEIDSSNYDIAIDYLTQNYSYYIFASRSINRQKNIFLFCSNDKMIFNDNSGTNYDQITFDTDNQNKTFIQFQVYMYPSNYTPAFSDLVSSWNNTEFNPSLNNHTYQNSNNTTINQNITNMYSGQNITLCYSNYDVKNSNGDVVHNNNVALYPTFDNTTEIQDGYPDGVFISPADYSKNDNLYFHLLEINTGISSSDSSIYYYSDKTFILNKDSDYYSTWYDPSIEGYYYYVPRYKLGLSQNTSYLYVLNNSKEQIQNSSGLYEKDIANGVFDVVQSDTAGVITATEEESDRMRNIESGILKNEEITNNINDSLTNTTVTEESETNIEESLNFSNDNSTLSFLRNGFFTRLSAMLANLTNYNLRQDTAVSIPLPHSDKNLTFHSIDIYNNVSDPLKTIINLFWVFIFNFYLFKFVNHLYISITTGKILKDFNAKNEVITDHML